MTRLVSVGRGCTGFGTVGFSLKRVFRKVEEDGMVSAPGNLIVGFGLILWLWLVISLWVSGCWKGAFCLDKAPFLEARCLHALFRTIVAY